MKTRIAATVQLFLRRLRCALLAEQGANVVEYVGLFVVGVALVAVIAAALSASLDMQLGQAMGDVFERAIAGFRAIDSVK